MILKYTGVACCFVLLISLFGTAHAVDCPPEADHSTSQVFFLDDHYEFDSSARKIINNIAACAKLHPERRLTVAGFHHVSGTSADYALSLGEKYAEIVVRALSVRKIAMERMEAISLGKDGPEGRGVVIRWSATAPHS